MAATAKAAKTKPKKTKVEASDNKPAQKDRFVIFYKDKPAIECRWLSNVVFDDAAEYVNLWFQEALLIERDELSELIPEWKARGATDEQIKQGIAIYDGKVESCPLHSQAPDKAVEFVRSKMPEWTHFLLHYLVYMAYGATGADPKDQCLFAHHKQMHLDEDRLMVQELRSRLEKQLRTSFPVRRRGSKSRTLKAPDQIVILATQYERLQTDKSFGDDKNRLLWEIICHRFDIGDLKWRDRARIDSDVPDTVLNLVPERHKLHLKLSHLALYHAAALANIEFTISQNSRGKRKITPSPSTLLRRCKDAAAAAELLNDQQRPGNKNLLEQRRKRTQERAAALEITYYPIETE